VASLALTNSELSFEDLSGPERSAALLMFVHPRVATGLLSRLSTGEVTQIGIAMNRLERISPELLNQIIAAFVTDLSDIKHMPHSGKDFALNQLADLIEPERRDAVHEPIRRELDDSFETFIGSCLPSAVAIMLQDEHPQAVATALLMMGPENASAILTLMLDREQYDFTRRMAKITTVDGRLARDVENSLRENLGSGLAAQLQMQGVDKTARILCRMGRAAYEPLLARIAKQDKALEQAIRKRMVRFEDLKVLDRRGVQSLLKEIDGADLLVALRGADAEILNLFLGNMSKRRSQDLVEELATSSPVPRKKVVEVQELMVQTTMRLHEEGVLLFPVGAEAEEML
jgi:flagellar motor switch protein FliG